MIVRPILAISEKQVIEALTVQQSIELARRAYLKLAKKQVIEPVRSWFTVHGGSSFYFMPAHVMGLQTVSIKVVSVSQNSAGRDLPTTIATVFVFDSKSGLQVARISANALTATRTAASSALATDALAGRQVETLGIIGTGTQSQAHLSAMLEARDFSRVLVFSRSRVHREYFHRKFSKSIGIPIVAVSSAHEVVVGSDVLVLATTSAVPIFRGKIIRPGSHVNAIGAALPNSREVDTFLVQRSILVVDSRQQALESYGEIVIPLKEKAIRKSHIKAELGQLILHPTSFRRREKDITLFKAGGVAALDAVFADYLVSQLIDR